MGGENTEYGADQIQILDVRSFRSGISNSGCSPSVSGTMPRSFPGPDRNGASCRRNTEFFRSGCTLRRGNAYICSTHIPIR